PIAGRTHVELESLIGFFVNTLVLRSDLSGDISFEALLAQVQTMTLDAFRHQDIPFEKLVEELQPERSLSHTPLFQVMFVLQNAPRNRIDLPDLQMERVRLGTSDGDSAARFDLTLHINETEKGLHGGFSYNADLFESITISRLVGHFQVLLQGIIDNPAQPIAQLPLLTTAEYRQIVYEWNDTAVDFGEPQTIHALFEQQVTRTPDAIALIFEQQQLTYVELNTRANQLAHHLRQLGVQADTLVALAIERSVEMVISLLAILKAGGAYVPIDPTYPLERIRYMLTDSAAPILLTQSYLPFGQETVRDTEPYTTHVIAVDMLEAQLATQSTKNPQTQTTTQDLVYMIYTSGSTGQPKGVMILHEGVFNLLRWTQNTLQLTSEDCVLARTSLSFDVACRELLLPLANGASIVMATDEQQRDLQQLLSLMKRHNVSVSHFTPTLLHSIMNMIEGEADFPDLRILMSGGEPLTAILANQILTIFAGKLVNSYGPTETTISVGLQPVTSGMSMMSIAPPASNTTFYILDAREQPVPVHIIGELYIGGMQLARGYKGRPDLTAERFIDHPEFGRLYKTGDLCRWLPDGNIEFLGRTDFQVKIRGFRIELGEIESVLLSQDDVREAVVLVREDALGDKQLVAYVVTSDRSQVEVDLPANLRRVLQEKLPDHMIPSAFVLLDAMPLTPNGKLDRKALPAPDRLHLSTTTFVVPRTLTEQKLADIWMDVLGVEQIGLQDNFFEMGGHSLLVVQMIAKVRRQFAMDLPVATLFQFPTLGQFAEQLQQVDVQQAWAPLVALQPRGSRLPFFCVHGLGGNVHRLYPLAQALGAKQPFYGLQAVGVDGKSTPFTEIEAMAAYYLSALRTMQPEGPYLLGGYSFGCQVAFEMARQLQAQGSETRRLILFDSGAPTQVVSGIDVLGGDVSGNSISPRRTIARVDWLMNNVCISAERHDKPLPKIDEETLRQLDEETQLQTLNQHLRQAGLPILEEGPMLANFAVFKANKEMVYHPSHAIDVPTVLLYTAKDESSKQALWGDDETMGWGELVKQPIDCRLVPGTHTSMMRKPQVQQVANILADYLTGAKGAS
ncbi:MAG: amino acid adenylation domain-containing protein, partial [Chloroflexota bacterium]